MSRRPPPIAAPSVRPPLWRRPLIIATAITLVAALATAAVLWQRSNVRLALIAASLPAKPDLSRFPAELATRTATAEDQARRQPREASAALARLATLYHANGYIAEARQCYQTLLQTDPTNPRWPHRLAGLAASYGELEVAIPLWQRTLQLDASYLPARLRLGDALLKSNRPQEAAAAYEAALKTEPGNPYALTGLARLDLQAGQTARARDRLEQAESRSNYAIGSDLLATVYEQLGDHDRAMAARSRAKSSGAYFDPPDPWTDEIFSDCYDPFQLAVAAGVAEHGSDLATARRLLDRAVELAPADGQLLLQFGMMDLRAQDPDSARRHLERAAAIAPQLPDVWAQLMVLYSAQGDAPAAQRALASGLIHCPNSPGLRLEHGRQLAAAGLTDEALAEYRASFRLRPEEAGPLIEIAKLFFRQEQIEEGVAELRHALKVEPANPTALLTLTLFAINTGDEAAAREWLRRAELQARVDRAQIAKLRTGYTERFGHAPRP
jgi:tetratricopeptide (TPR) repeat protein